MASIAFIDSSGIPYASHYYRMFPKEPIPPENSKNFVDVGKIISVKDNSLKTMLASIKAHAPKKSDILIVCHGTSSGLELYIGNGKNKIGLSSSTVDILTKNQCSDSESAKRLKTSVEEYKKIRSYTDEVRKLDINRVDIRACNVGSNKYSLSALQIFFNCAVLSAPSEFTVFGPVPYGKITSDAKYWRDWLKKRPDAKIFGKSPHRFALSYLVSARFTVVMSALAESYNAIKLWADYHLLPNKYSRGKLFYNGLLKTKTIIFAGEPGYRKYIEEAKKGHAPSKILKLTPF